MLKRPYVVVEWNDTKTTATGWLCVYNFVAHHCGGGTRMHPSVTKEEVIRLATTMGYKYKACQSNTTGGCKFGIAYDYKAPDAKAVLKRFLIAMAPYIQAGICIGGDLGVDYGDIVKICDEIGISTLETNSMRKDPKFKQYIKNHDDACQMEYDGFLMYDLITGYGCAFALDEAWNFKQGKSGATVVLQGFGCVGASMAYCLDNMGYKVIGIADANCLVTCKTGLNVKKLVETRKPQGELDPSAFESNYTIRPNADWLDIDCDILVPAALEDVINLNNADKVKASLIVEAANIPVTAEAENMLFKKGVDICVDFVSNMGGVRLHDALMFGLVGPVPEDIIKDTELLVRNATSDIFKKSKEQGKSQRQVALEIYEPDVFDTPDI